mmetsp:Transcript_51707/g.110558  ORF Transcript_51707/g.110558 Transcript_51707/m.110558 type:complete len:248 (-) Transcript_51707:383-1126(-)
MPPRRSSPSTSPSPSEAASALWRAGGVSAPKAPLVPSTAGGNPPKAEGSTPVSVPTCRKMLSAVLTIEDTLPGSAGTTIVFDCLAISFQAATHCSATRKATAFSPQLELEIAELRSLIPSALALARSTMACASPWARRIAASRLPCAKFTSLCLSPSLWSTSARRRRSASACISIACLMDDGGMMSRISYLKHWMPQASAALLTMDTMAAFIVSRSSKVLSKVIFPISDRIVVCASCITAKIGSWTP